MAAGSASSGLRRVPGTPRALTQQIAELDGLLLECGRGAGERGRRSRRHVLGAIVEGPDQGSRVLLRRDEQRAGNGVESEMESGTDADDELKHGEPAEISRAQHVTASSSSSLASTLGHWLRRLRADTARPPSAMADVPSAQGTRLREGGPSASYASLLITAGSAAERARERQTRPRQQDMITRLNRCRRSLSAHAMLVTDRKCDPPCSV